MRHYKLKYMITTLPNNAKNCLLIRYEDLIDNYGFYMNLLKKRGWNLKKYKFSIVQKIYEWIKTVISIMIKKKKKKK